MEAVKIVLVELRTGHGTTTVKAIEDLQLAWRMPDGPQTAASHLRCVLAGTSPAIKPLFTEM